MCHNECSNMSFCGLNVDVERPAPLVSGIINQSINQSIYLHHTT